MQKHQTFFQNLAHICHTPVLTLGNVSMTPRIVRHVMFGPAQSLYYMYSCVIYVTDTHCSHAGYVREKKSVTDDQPTRLPIEQAFRNLSRRLHIR